MGIKDIPASVQNILECKYITNMGIEVVSASVKNFLATAGGNLLNPLEQKTYEQVYMAIKLSTVTKPV